MSPTTDTVLCFISDATRTFSALLLSANHEKNEVFWGILMKMEDDNNKKNLIFNHDPSNVLSIICFTSP